MTSIESHVEENLGNVGSYKFSLKSIFFYNYSYTCRREMDMIHGKDSFHVVSLY